MKGKLVAVLLLVCAIGAGTAAAKAPKKAAFDLKYDCAKVAPGSLVSTLAGGFGGTYALKRTKVDHVQTGRDGTGGYSHCDYSQSAGYPWSAKAEGPGEVTVLYGTAAGIFYKRDHAAAVEGVKCTNLKAQTPTVTPDPRQCGPVAVTGLGDKAYEAASYIAVLRGRVFLAVALSSPPDANGQPQLVPSELLQSIATALLRRVPAM